LLTAGEFAGVRGRAAIDADTRGVALLMLMLLASACTAAEELR
jgi:hypothetical protein